MIKGNDNLCGLINISFYFDDLRFVRCICDCCESKVKDQYQFYHCHQVIYKLQLTQAMKKGPTPHAPSPSRGTLIHEIAKYLLRGVVLGVIFQGTFLMFSFENRIRRSMATKRLEEVKMLEEETAERIRRGQKPLIEEEFLRDRVVANLKDREQKIV